MKKCKPQKISTCIYRILERSEFVDNGIRHDYTGIAWWICTKCGHLKKST